MIRFLHHKYDLYFIKFPFNYYDLINVFKNTEDKLHKNSDLIYNDIKEHSKHNNDANASIFGNVIFNNTSLNMGIPVVDITISINPSSATLYDTDPAVNAETHPTTTDDTCSLSTPMTPTIDGLEISYSACQSYYLNTNTTVCFPVATLVTTPAGDYSYSIEDAGTAQYYEISGTLLSRNPTWEFPAVAQVSNIPTSVVITTTNDDNETFNTTLTITYDSYDPNDLAFLANCPAPPEPPP
jgi:hypothetical protein